MLYYRDREIKYGITHSGKFHADDVFGAALLSILTDKKIRILRVNQSDLHNVMYEANHTILFDVGDGEFDHHKEIERRKTGNQSPYAAFGKLWREFAVPNILSTTYARDKFDRMYIEDLDLADTTGSFNVLSKIIAAYYPGPQASINKVNNAFEQAFYLAIEILEKLISDIQEQENTKYKIIDREVKYAREHGIDVVCFNRDLACWDYIESVYPDINLVLYPSSHGGWSLRSLSLTNPITGEFIDNKYKFPERYRGHRDELLIEYPDIGMKFCHLSGFMAQFNEKEDALRFITNYMK